MFIREKIVEFFKKVIFLNLAGKCLAHGTSVSQLVAFSYVQLE